MRASGDEELEGIAEFGLNGLTGDFRVPLMGAIHVINTANGDALKKAAANAHNILTGFRQHLNADKKVEACDENPFGVKVTIRETFGQGLDQLAQALSAAPV